MSSQKKRRKKRKKLTWQDIVMIIMVIILALLLVFSRGFRAARRVHMDTPPHQQAYNPASAADHEAGELLQPDNEKGGMQESDPLVGPVSDNPPGGTIQTTHYDEPGRSLPLIQDADMESNRMQLQDISEEMLIGRIEPASDTDNFIPVEARYARRDGMYLRHEAMDAFVAMHAAAEREGIQLIILSATRTFDHQQRIWENKWNGERLLHGDIYATEIDDPVERGREILRFSAMPGTSRHHWGTDIDMNSLQNSYFEQGQGMRVYQWLKDNAATYGFCQPYTVHGKQRDGGYEEEKWHWSYKPLASLFYRAFKENISYDDIAGFDGANTAREIQVIENYVLDVNRECF